MIITSKRRRLLLIACTLVSAAGTAAIADENRPTYVDWKRLNLSNDQSQHVQNLEQDWRGKYQHMQPQIIVQQRHLARLLSDPKADPLEIMSTQQTITRLKEQLRNEATANYLRKRAVLNDMQQHQLETMMQQMVADRQQLRGLTPASAGLDPNNGTMGDLMHKVKWAIEPH